MLVGRENYRRYGKMIEVDLEAEPDLILRPEIGAKVAFAQFLQGSRTATMLRKYFNETTEDWEGARREFVGASLGIEAVTVRSKAFLQCIRDFKARSNGCRQEVMVCNRYPSSPSVAMISIPKPPSPT